MTPDAPSTDTALRRKRRDNVIAAIREAIAQGRLRPGERLASFAELRKQFKAGQATVRRALAKLQDLGFLESRAESGVFVALTPPHVRNLGVVFPGHPSEPLTWSTFLTAIERHVDRLAPRAGFKVIKFYRTLPDLNRPETRELRRLVDEHQLAGLLLASPQLLGSCEWLRLAALPRVVVWSQSMPGVPSVSVDDHAMFDLAFRRCHELGHRRVAVLLLNSRPQEAAKQICLLAAEHGIMTPPHWVQGAAKDESGWAANVVELLFRQPSRDRPDALFVTDDHLVTSATAGLLAAGVAVPGEVVVIAHCNVGFQPPTRVPVQFLGFDGKKLVATCLERLKQLQRGEAFPPLTLLPPRFVKPD